MATYSNAARTVGVRKRRQPLPEALSDSQCTVRAPPEPRGGFAPATRLKTKIKTFLRRKTKKRSAPSRWSGPSRTRQGQTKQNLRKPAPSREEHLMLDRKSTRLN